MCALLRITLVTDSQRTLHVFGRCLLKDKYSIDNAAVKLSLGLYRKDCIPTCIQPPLTEQRYIKRCVR